MGRWSGSQVLLTEMDSPGIIRGSKVEGGLSFNHELANGPDMQVYPPDLR
ncbi:hypothetical protein LBYZC6_23350 [Lacrimispora brassicae]